MKINLDRRLKALNRNYDIEMTDEKDPFLEWIPFDNVYAEEPVLCLCGNEINDVYFCKPKTQQDIIVRIGSSCITHFEKIRGKEKIKIYKDSKKVCSCGKKKKMADEACKKCLSKVTQNTVKTVIQLQRTRTYYCKGCDARSTEKCKTCKACVYCLKMIKEGSRCIGCQCEGLGCNKDAVYESWYCESCVSLYYCWRCGDPKERDGCCTSCEKCIRCEALIPRAMKGKLCRDCWHKSKK